MKIHTGCLLLIFCIFFSACQSLRPFTQNALPPAPDYSNPAHWAALPDKSDPADRTPDSSLHDGQATAEVDVFFVHPTTFWKKSDKRWNADVNDHALNEKTDRSTILHQASVFNGSGRVFAPRYRQAHIRTFFTKDKESARQALDLAYQDVAAAFRYYLDHYNHGRPIIIAGHSQGGRHGLHLLQSFFDGKILKNRLVVAYLVGWPIPKGALKDIPPCQTPEQTGCVCSWRSFRHGYIPKKYDISESIIVVNPLTWTTDTQRAPLELNEGTVLRNFTLMKPGVADAQIYKGILWVNKPKFPGSFLFRRKNYHIADLNFFYVNVRNNARHRVNLFWK